MNLVVVGDARQLPIRDGCVQCVVTSPPYFGLRDYGIAPRVWGGDEGCDHVWEQQRTIGGGKAHTDKVRWQHTGHGPHGHGATNGAACSLCGAWLGSLGLEPTHGLFVEHVVDVFREIRRVLRDDGVLWLNFGDSYNAYNGNAGPSSSISNGRHDAARPDLSRGHGLLDKALKPKDLIGVPWRVALALQADGWYLRSDIIWAKPNPMPESVTDRPTKAHEYIFLLTKSERYQYDGDAIREPYSQASLGRYNSPMMSTAPGSRKPGGDMDRRRREQGIRDPNPLGRNKRSVWTVTTESFTGSHFATFPEKLVEPCILAGSKPGDLVLDPFAGTGTVGRVALKHGRRFVGVELNPKYAGELAPARLRDIQTEMQFGGR